MSWVKYPSYSELGITEHWHIEKGKITINLHSDGKVWRFICYAVSLGPVAIGEDLTADQAKAAALELVKEHLLSVLSDLNEIMDDS